MNRSPATAPPDEALTPDTDGRPLWLDRLPREREDRIQALRPQPLPRGVLTGWCCHGSLQRTKEMSWPTHASDLAIASAPTSRAGGGEPTLLLPNASGLTWLAPDRRPGAYGVTRCDIKPWRRATPNSQGPCRVPLVQRQSFLMNEAGQLRSLDFRGGQATGDVRAPDAPPSLHRRDGARQ